MLIFVVVCNLFLALVNLYIALRIWKLRKVLANVTETLTNVERRVHRVLYPSPVVISKAQTGTAGLRESYRRLEMQMQKLQQVLVLLNFGYRMWQRKPGGRLNPQRRRKR